MGRVKRANYDRFGMDDEQMHRHHGGGSSRRAYSGGRPGFDGEIDLAQEFTQNPRRTSGGDGSARSGLVRCNVDERWEAGAGAAADVGRGAACRAGGSQTRQMIMQFVPILLVMLFTLFASDGTERVSS